jgi:hypothetical protein
VIRNILLTLLLIALGAGLVLPWTAARLGDLGGLDLQRTVVLWGLPVAALILSLLFHPRLRRPDGEGPGSPARRLVLLGVCLLALVADQSFLGVAYATGQATLTPSMPDPTGRSALLAAAWMLPACLILGIWGWERALRGSVYTGWRRSLSRPMALAVSAAVGVVLALPPFLPGGEPHRDLVYIAAALAVALCREVSFGLLFLRGGGLLVAGLYRGLLAFVEIALIDDWSSLRFPAFGYVTGGPRFYAVRVASALLALGVVALLSRRQRPAEPQGNLPETSDETGAPQ